MNKEIQEALAEIAAPKGSSSRCWAQRLPEEALELLYGIEALVAEGKEINRKIAVRKFNEMYGDVMDKPVSLAMMERHLLPAGKGCACYKKRGNYV